MLQNDVDGKMCQSIIVQRLIKIRKFEKQKTLEKVKVDWPIESCLVWRKKVLKISHINFPMETFNFIITLHFRFNVQLKLFSAYQMT